MSDLPRGFVQALFLIICESTLNNLFFPITKRLQDHTYLDRWEAFIWLVEHVVNKGALNWNDLDSLKRSRGTGHRFIIVGGRAVFFSMTSRQSVSCLPFLFHETRTLAGPCTRWCLVLTNRVLDLRAFLQYIGQQFPGPFLHNGKMVDTVAKKCIKMIVFDSQDLLWKVLSK